MIPRKPILPLSLDVFVGDPAETKSSISTNDLPGGFFTRAACFPQSRKEPIHLFKNAIGFLDGMDDFGLGRLYIYIDIH